jgi:hypothetical protein
MTHDVGCKTRVPIPPDVTVSAQFAGPNDCYRIRLEHRWGNGPAVMFAMMNPSAASTKESDATIRKCGQFARRWGYRALLVGNACAYRATNPKTLLTVSDACGAIYNWPALANLSYEADMIVIAHGRLPKKLAIHGRQMCAILMNSGKPLHALRVSEDGNPWHPLYLPLDTVPFIWRETAGVGT